MPAGQRFCTACGAPLSPGLKFCTSCGAPADAAGDLPPPQAFRPAPPPPPPGFAAAAPPPPPGYPAAPPVPAEKILPPTTFFGLVSLTIHSFIKNIRATSKGIIKAMIISFAAVLVLQTLLLALHMDTSAIINSVLAVAGFQSSPDALFFWFLATAIIAFAYSQVRGMGTKKAIAKAGSLLSWIGSAARSAGSFAFPLLMTGCALALLVRLYLLSAVTGVQFLILLFGVLYSQQESLAILAIRLLYSDVNRVAKKTGPSLPRPAFPVMGVAGACAGLILVLFFSDIVILVAVTAALAIIGFAIILIRKKRAAPPKSGLPASPAGSGGKMP